MFSVDPRWAYRVNKESTFAFQASKVWELCVPQHYDSILTDTGAGKLLLTRERNKRQGNRPINKISKNCAKFCKSHTQEADTADNMWDFFFFSLDDYGRQQREEVVSDKPKLEG